MRTRDQESAPRDLLWMLRRKVSKGQREERWYSQHDVEAGRKEDFPNLVSNNTAVFESGGQACDLPGLILSETLIAG